jgi:CRP-like cAMP-binding protein
MIMKQDLVRNRLLRRLPTEAFEMIADHLRPIDLPVRRALVQPRKPIEAVCFIESGLASMVAESSDAKSVEIRHIGFEGITGYPVILGIDSTPNKTFMQVGGHGLQIASEDFLPLMEIGEARELLLRYVHTCELQLAHTALAAAKYHMHERLSRWLLMCHDRIEGDELPLTHDFLGLMLGVRRSGVTNQLHILEGLHAIRSMRGIVRILDRDKLIKIAGGCYGVPEEEYERLIGSRSPKTGRPHGEIGNGLSLPR